MVKKLRRILELALIYIIIILNTTVYADNDICKYSYRIEVIELISNEGVVDSTALVNFIVTVDLPKGKGRVLIPLPFNKWEKDHREGPKVSYFTKKLDNAIYSIIEINLDENLKDDLKIHYDNVYYKIEINPDNIYMEIPISDMINVLKMWDCKECEIAQINKVTIKYRDILYSEPLGFKTQELNELRIEKPKKGIKDLNSLNNIQIYYSKTENESTPLFVGFIVITVTIFTTYKKYTDTKKRKKVILSILFGAIIMALCIVAVTIKIFNVNQYIFFQGIGIGCSCVLSGFLLGVIKQNKKNRRVNDSPKINSPECSK